MHGRASALTTILLLVMVMGLAWSNPGSMPLTTSATPPNSPYTGTGSTLNVHEFARNDSVSSADATNDSAFSYAGNWYPAGYRGYRLLAEVSNLRKTVDPVPNGDIDHYDEPGNNWTLTQIGTPPHIVSSVDNGTGGNPGHCLNVTLANQKVRDDAAYIYNNFTYVSQIPPDSLTLSFDIKYSSNVTNATWLIVEVSIFHGASQWSWSRTTYSYMPTSWSHNGFSTGAVNGSVTLRVTIRKTSTGNVDVSGSIAFDNFRYTIGSYSPPSEVGLAINGTAFVDTGGSWGTADIYADPALKERASAIACWNTTRQFQFASNYTITFEYRYSMYIKMETPDAAFTFFTAPADALPTWVTNYTIPGGRPPSGHTGYRFGLFLPDQWVFSLVKNGTGHSISPYSYDASSRFFLLDENVGITGQSFGVYASAADYVLQVHAQRGPAPSGPWTNTTASDYFSTGDYLRVFADLLPIGVTGNSANVSVLLPNNTLWRSDSAPTFDADRDTLTSVAWQMPVITEPIAGNDWLVTVSFNTPTQCGMRTQSFAAYIEPKGSIISPAPGSRYVWGSSLFVNVTWQNNATLAYITNAGVRVHYVDSYSQAQYATMSSNDQGAYFTSISTSLLTPSSAVQFDVEFFKVGYVNASYAEGSHLAFTVNLVSDQGSALFNLLAVVAVIVVLLLVAGFLAYSRYYRPRVLAPRRSVRKQKLQDAADTFSDVVNLSRFLVLHRASGIAIFDPFAERGMDAALFGGFLQAISAFAVDVARTTENDELPLASPLHEITYEGFRILIHDGRFVRTALVFKGQPSENLKKKTEEFTTRFEAQYFKELSQWCCEPEVFQDATRLLEEIFHVSLLLPHKVQPKVPDTQPLTDLEANLYGIALALTEHRDSVLLHEVIQAYTTAFRADKREVLSALFQLREKKLLSPIEFYRLSKKAREQLAPEPKTPGKSPSK